MSTVSIGSNQKYAENWDSIFRKAKSAKQQPVIGKAKSEAPTKKKGKANKPAAKSGKRKG